MNWADRRDNFVDGPIVPSGIDDRASPEEAGQVATQIASQFKKLFGVNSVRLGINPDTVLDESWWPKHRAVISSLRAADLNVILACWEGASSRDGRIDDRERFDKMWRRVIGDFADDPQVLFEAFNEPHGYSDNAWRDLVSDWVAVCAPRLGEQGRARLLISGSGYNERLRRVGADPRLGGCLLSFHLYAWFVDRRDAGAWEAEIRARIGEENKSRTVVTEWGELMKGLPQDFYSRQDGRGRRSRAYLQGMSNVIRGWDMGSVYWPGLRDADPFSLAERAPGRLQLSITNKSGLELLQRSFGKD